MNNIYIQKLYHLRKLYESYNNEYPDDNISLDFIISSVSKNGFGERTNIFNNKLDIVGYGLLSRSDIDILLQDKRIKECIRENKVFFKRVKKFVEWVNKGHKTVEEIKSRIDWAAGKKYLITEGISLETKVKIVTALLVISSIGLKAAFDSDAFLKIASNITLMVSVSLYIMASVA